MDKLQKIREESVAIESGLGRVQMKLEEIDYQDANHIVFQKDGKDYQFGSSIIPVMLKILHMPHTFSRYVDGTLGADEWLRLVGALKAANADTRLNISADANGEVVSVARTNRDQFSNSVILDLLEEAGDFEVKNYNINKDAVMFLEVVKPNSDFEVLQGDVWKSGISLLNDPFGNLGTRADAYLDRLVCGNGMRSKVFSYTARLRNEHDTLQKLQQKVLKILDAPIQDKIIERVQLLSNTRASVQEVRSAAGMLLGFREEVGEGEFAPKCDLLVDSTLGLYDLAAVYRTDFDKQSRKWLQSAKSNWNYYDLINYMTWIASHNKLGDLDITLDDEEKFTLRLQASNMFFKKQLDLVDVAPAKKIESMLFDPS